MYEVMLKRRDIVSTQQIAHECPYITLQSSSTSEEDTVLHCKQRATKTPGFFWRLSSRSPPPLPALPTTNIVRRAQRCSTRSLSFWKRASQ